MEQESTKMVHGKVSPPRHQKSKPNSSKTKNLIKVRKTKYLIKATSKKVEKKTNRPAHGNHQHFDYVA